MQIITSIILGAVVMLYLLDSHRMPFLRWVVLALFLTGVLTYCNGGA